MFDCIVTLKCSVKPVKFSQSRETKQRNKLLTCTVDAILMVRAGLKRVNKCCHNFDLPKSVLDKIGTMAAYSSSSVTETETVDSEGE